MSRPDCPVPHMGWNQLRLGRGSALLAGIADGDYVYFVHSYAAPPGRAHVATCDYGGEFAAVVQHGQFLRHAVPPRALRARGRRLLANFLSPRRHGADPRHRSARRALRAPAARATSTPRRATRRPAGARCALSRAGRRTGCTSSISTARATARRRTATLIVASRRAAGARAPGRRRRALGGSARPHCSRSVSRASSIGSVAVRQPDELRHWLERTAPDRIVLALDVRHDAARRAACWPRTAGSRPDRGASSFWDAGRRAMLRSGAASRAVHRRRPRRRAHRAEPRRCTQKPCVASRRLPGRPRAACASAATCAALRATGAAAAISGQALLEATDRS